MKSGIWGAVALAAIAFGPAGCGEAPDEAAAATAGVEGIAVTNARLMLPAVKGNPGALYFDVANTHSQNRVIRAVSIAGAGSAMMHHTVEGGAMQEAAPVMVPAGGNAKFEPEGKHVMAMDLADTVTAGSKAEVTLTFLGGTTQTFSADVRAAGDDR